jgi:K+-transporting ATPase KdpF subunit
MHHRHHPLLQRSRGLYHGLRPARHERGSLMIETVLLSLVTLALLGYLVYALLRPEKF